MWSQIRFDSSTDCWRVFNLYNLAETLQVVELVWSKSAKTLIQLECVTMFYLNNSIFSVIALS